MWAAHDGLRLGFGLAAHFGLRSVFGRAALPTLGSDQFLDGLANLVPNHRMIIMGF